MTASTKIDLLALSRQEMSDWLEAHGFEKFRTKQIYHALYTQLITSSASIAGLPQPLHTFLAEQTYIGTATIQFERHSKDNRTRKILLSLEDRKLIESVLMLYPPHEEQGARATVCVSSQAGCAFGCTFCATGQMGFERHLQPGEIVYQVLHFARELRAYAWRAEGLPHSESINHITNIVMMGMGEPLHNYDNVMKALHILHDPEGFNLGARHITLSTAGVVPGIYKLIEEEMPINLAISLHAPTNDLRSMTMPINKKYPIEEIIKACAAYIEKKRRQVTFEYVLLSSVNDTPAHAQQLAELLQPLHQFAHVNCIPVNATGARYRPPTPDAIRTFRAILTHAHVSNTVRAERGDDIAAACGQLKTQAIASTV